MFLRFDVGRERAQLGLLAPWAVFHRVIDGRAVLDRYLEESGRRLSAEEREWLDAQRSAWLSVWEATDVRPGEGLTIQDLLSGEVRTVREVSASRTLVRRDAVLARVVDWRGFSWLCGMHPRALPPSHAADVVRRARARLRRPRDVPVERLREEAFGRYLIARWDEPFEDLVLRASVRPKLTNTDACAYVVRGRIHLEWGAGGCQQVELAAGDFYVISPHTIHREGNPGADVQVLAGFYLGPGPVVVNVDGPAAA